MHVSSANFRLPPSYLIRGHAKFILHTCSPSDIRGTRPNCLLPRASGGHRDPIKVPRRAGPRLNSADAIAVKRIVIGCPDQHGFTPPGQLQF